MCVRIIFAPIFVFNIWHSLRKIVRKQLKTFKSGYSITIKNKVITGIIFAIGIAFRLPVGKWTVITITEFDES